MAVTLGMMHVCPMATGPIPHVGGPLLLGDPSFLVGGCPTGFLGCPVLCIGPPDVAMGTPINLIMGGAPMTDIEFPTAHGGVWSMFNPVLIS